MDKRAWSLTVLGVGAAAALWYFRNSVSAVVALGTGMISDKVKAFAHAISVAEGFGLPGAIPTVRNNPGDLTSGGAVTTYPDVATGWAKLYNQLEVIISGVSSHYDLDMTISDMAHTYTATEPDAWAANVARELGVSVDTPLRDLLT